MTRLCAAIAMIALTAAACDDADSPRPRVVVIGFDGMDPILCERLMDAGRMPRLAAIRDGGGYRRLGTSIPPQSPVAWSNFITGAGPGVHGIFDFIHRDPARQCEPYYSAAQTVPGDDGWKIGKHNLPLTFWPFNHNPTQTLLRRHGVPFWDHLDEAGIPIRIYDIPSNYPPSPSLHGHMCCLSGMGVPDLLGSYGTYHYFSSDTARTIEEAGGIRKPFSFSQHYGKNSLAGPENTSLQKPARVSIPFEVYRHPTEPFVKIEIQDQTIVLREGEWSDWRKLDYQLEMPPFLPAARAPGICRFYLQEVRPTFRLYVTPVNIDPSDPGEQRISEPPEFVEQISEALGMFYTAGFQEDHKALTNRVFNDEEYLRQARYVLEERRRLLEYALNNYRDGLLFFYFSSTDLQAHMFWWEGDGKHPVRSAADARKYHMVIEDLYAEMDRIVGQVMDRIGSQAAFLLLSDHGFCNFSRQFNVNTWLRDQGYISPRESKSLMNSSAGRLVDWASTRAYGLGLNGLYVNLKGRERDGIVGAGERDALLGEISRKLLELKDPLDGKPVIARVYRSDEVYSGPFAHKGPDLIIGYHRGYRASWASTEGNIEDQMISANDSAWSADHCIAAEEVPGVLFMNRSIAAERPSLVDIAPTILDLFGMATPATMEGRSILQAEKLASREKE
jgi:predicted AlkP superfamily phosphohydrolase/phosphomutase